jgi:homoserine kinase
MTNNTDTQTSLDTRVFTPLNANGQRLEFPIADLTVISGQPFSRGLGARGTVRIAGVLYLVSGAKCGLGCQCDAVITEVV